MTIFRAMPRIDPLQLLRCLSVLLSPDGGIKSHEEVQRLASLMTKFSKKLVSKCIYIQILKSTRTDLLGMFMGAGGWNLTHTWLSDAIVVKNWPLIQELLELLLMCPVDVERLKTNNCPKLIKGLSKDGSSESVRLLASKLVEQWLRIVKGESVELNANIVKSSEPQVVASDTKENSVNTAEVHREPLDVSPVKIIKKECEDKPEFQVKKEEDAKIPTSDNKLVEEEKKPEVHIESVKEEEKEEKVLTATVTEETGTSEDSGEDTTWNVPMGQLPVYKITIRDGKQVLAKVTSADRPKKANAEMFVDAVEIDTTAVQKCDSVATVVTDSPDTGNKEVENVDTKTTVESKAPVTKAKKKLDKSENNSVPTKAAKESQKKMKDGKGTSNSVKTPEKKNIKSVEFVKDKAKVINKDKSKEKMRNKNREKGKEKEKLNEMEKDGEKGRLKEGEKEKLKEGEKEKSKDGEKDRIKGGDRDKLKEAKLQERKSDVDKDQIEKDNAALAKLIPPSISKLGKIPKKVHTDDSQTQPETKPVMSEIKKPPEIKPKKLSISIEVRKPTGDASRPKTVKTYNSKFRSTGLEEEVKPPPPRIIKKPVTLDKRPVKLPVLKRPSPVKEIGPPEKKLKPALTDVTSSESKKNEKSGAIKLIPPRPKPCFLQESDMFMDALNASSKKEPRKRKRRISNSKDVSEPKKDGNGKEEECRDTTPPESPVHDENKSPPIVKPTFKFYQDTLETDDDKPSEDKTEHEGTTKNEIETTKDKEDEENTKSPGDEVDDVLKVPLEESENRIASKEENSNESTDETQSDSLEEQCVRLPKGVLIYHKTRKGPKKNVRWKAEKDLEDVRFFELDETERVNVTKNFMDMKQMERSHEREAFLLARKLPQDDIMEEKTTWQPLIPIDIPTNLVEPGKNSREKEIQYAREKVVLQALYFSRNMIPDSPAEPDMEIHATTDPVIIPLDDITGNPDSVNDFQNTPWPEPKLAPPSPPHQYPVPQPQFPTFQQSQQFPPQPVFPPQQSIPPTSMTPPVGMMVPNSMNAGGGDWRTGDGKIVPINEMPVPMDMYNAGMPPMNMGMPPNIPGPMPEMNYGMMPDEMNQGAPFPMQGFPMAGPPNMFGPGPYRGGAQGHNMRGHNMGGGGRGRGGRGQWFNPIGGGGGGGGWQRGGRGGRGNWNGPSRTPCKHFRNGYCRHGDKCPFLHPGINGPQY